MYSYKESARKHGYKIALIGLVIAVICLGIFILIWNVPVRGYAEYFYLIFLPIMFIPGVVMLFAGLMQIARGGEFDIDITQKKIIWNQPSYLGDSFQFELDQIDFIKKNTRVKKSGKTKSKYSLVIKGSKEQRLTKQSNVSIEKVVEALTASGVEIREQRP